MLDAHDALWPIDAVQAVRRIIEDSLVLEIREGNVDRSGWLLLVGQITITLAVNFGTTLFFVACVNVFTDSEGNGVFEGTDWQVFLIFLAITLLCNAVSSLGNRWLPLLDVRMTPSPPV